MSEKQTFSKFRFSAVINTVLYWQLNSGSLVQESKDTNKEPSPKQELLQNVSIVQNSILIFNAKQTAKSSTISHLLITKSDKQVHPKQITYSTIL